LLYNPSSHQWVKNCLDLWENFKFLKFSHRIYFPCVVYFKCNK
jgi:hypothetical protein